MVTPLNALHQILNAKRQSAMLLALAAYRIYQKMTSHFVRATTQKFFRASVSRGTVCLLAPAL